MTDALRLSRLHAKIHDRPSLCQDGNAVYQNACLTAIIGTGLAKESLATLIGRFTRRDDIIRSFERDGRYYMSFMLPD